MIGYEYAIYYRIDFVLDRLQFEKPIEPKKIYTRLIIESDIIQTLPKWEEYPPSTKQTRTISSKNGRISSNEPRKNWPNINTSIITIQSLEFVKGLD